MLCRRLLYPLLVLATSTLLGLALAELGARIVLPAPKDEPNLTYRFDARLGWYPKEDSSNSFTASRTIEVHHNRIGLRDVEPGPKTQKRLLFLGDSFVWGFDVNQQERFTDILRRSVRRFQIINAGVSGYGTDQEFLLLQELFDRLMPDHVFLVFCTENDRDDNSFNFSVSFTGPYFHEDGYYKPYFEAKNGKLELNGLPVPRSVTYYRIQFPMLFQSRLVTTTFGLYRRYTSPVKTVTDPTETIFKAMKEYLDRRGVTLTVGLTKPDPKLEMFLNTLRVDSLELDTPLRYPKWGHHWTPHGHEVVSNRIRSYLEKEEW